MACPQHAGSVQTTQSQCIADNVTSHSTPAVPFAPFPPKENSIEPMDNLSNGSIGEPDPSQKVLIIGAGTCWEAASGLVPCCKIRSSHFSLGCTGLSLAHGLQKVLFQAPLPATVWLFVQWH